MIRSRIAAWTPRLARWRWRVAMGTLAFFALVSIVAGGFAFLALLDSAFGALEALTGGDGLSLGPWYVTTALVVGSVLLGVTAVEGMAALRLLREERKAAAGIEHSAAYGSMQRIRERQAFAPDE